MKKMEKISILSDGSILYLSDNNEILITLDELKDATGRVDLYELYISWQERFHPFRVDYELPTSSMNLFDFY